MRLMVEGVVILLLVGLSEGFSAPPPPPPSAKQKIVQLQRLIESDESTCWRWINSQRRYLLLCDLLRRDPSEYKRVAEELLDKHGLSERLALPNLEDIAAPTTTANATFDESLWEKFLLSSTRTLYHARGGKKSRSTEPGIRGLLAEMLEVAKEEPVEFQKDAVVNVLKDLMTPALPPFYKFFVTGKPWQNYATALVAPVVFGYLVGPATVNRRIDGQRGGLIVHRCKFLQESGCKGLCLHSCKLPAQELFAKDLGVPLTVSPNFDTFECQWSWGIDPEAPERDPKWPQGCLDGCPTRSAFPPDKQGPFCV